MNALSAVNVDDAVKEICLNMSDVRDAPTTVEFSDPTDYVPHYLEQGIDAFALFFESVWTLDGSRNAAWMRTFNETYERPAWDLGEDTIGAILQQLRQPNALVSVQAGQAMLTFRVNGGALQSFVYYPRGDILKDFLASGPVRLGIILEYIASSLGLTVGNSWHTCFELYSEDKLPKHLEEVENPGGRAPLCEVQGEVDTTLLQDLRIYVDDGPLLGFRSPFVRRVVSPLHYAHQAFVHQDFAEATRIASGCADASWRTACLNQIEQHSLALERTS